MGCSSSKPNNTKGGSLDSTHLGSTNEAPREGSSTDPNIHKRKESTNYLSDNFTDDDIKKKLQHDAPIYRVVLTGGPCAGKSTLLSLIQTKFSQRTGIKVYCVPEAATLLVGGGLEWKDMTEEKVIEYQLALLRTQVSLEDQLYAIAKANGVPALVVSDRGTMDGRAYCSPEQFAEILRRGGWNMETLRDERYDAIVHMVSAAIGAKQHYNLDNPARFENVHEAAINDQLLRQMYVGHPLLRVFDNSTPFDIKLERVLAFIGNIVGHQFPHNTTRRFVLKRPPLESEITMPFVRARITITILNNSSEDEVMQVMKREQDKACIYFYTCIKKRTSNMNSSLSMSSHLAALPPVVETTGTDEPIIWLPPEDTITKSEHRISVREYASLLHQRDPTRVDVVKDNISFVFQSHYVEVATFLAPYWAVGRSITYIDSEDANAPIDIPPFLEVDHERKNGWASSMQVSLKSNNANLVVHHDASPSSSDSNNGLSSGAIDVKRRGKRRGGNANGSDSPASR